MWRKEEECKSIQTTKNKKGLKLIKQMTKKKTKRKLEKLKTKTKTEWNSTGIRYENHEKKKVTNCG